MGNKVSVDITSFSAGEVDASLSGRTDDPNYNKSLQLCENWIPTIHGGIVKRGGTFRAGTSDDGDAPLLIPYGDQYMLEFTPGTVRIWDGGSGVLAGTVSGNPITSSYVRYVNWAQKDDLLVICGVGLSPYVFTMGPTGTNPTLTAMVFDKGPLDTQNIDLDLYQLASAVSGSGITIKAYKDVTTSASQIDTTLAVGQLIGFRCVPQMLANQWTTGNGVTAGDYRWSQSYESSRVNMYKATTTGTTGTRAPGHDIGTESDGAVSWQMVHSEWGFARVTSKTGTPEHAVATVVGFPELPQDSLTGVGHANGTWRWAQGLWGKTIVEGISITSNYPYAVTFHQQRLVFGGGAIDKQQLHGSAIDDFTNFYPGLTDANAAYKFILDSEIPVNINSLKSLNNLIVGTSGGVYMARASNGGPVTPTDIDIRLKSNVPIGPQQGAMSEQSIFWTEDASKDLYEFTVDGDNITAFNRGFLNETVGQPIKIVKMASPYNVIWAIYYDGVNFKLCGFSNSEQYGLRGWHRHTIAGTMAETGGGIVDIAVVPNAPNQLWLSIKRALPLASTGSIEILSFDNTTNDPVGSGTLSTYKGVYLDSAAYQSTALTTITGLDHLEGETINIVKDGAVVQEIVVESNQAVMSEERSAFFYGLPFTASGKTQKLEGGSRVGSSQGRQKKVERVIFRLRNTGEGLRAGTKSTNVSTVYGRTTSHDMDTAVPLKTGDIKFTPDGGPQDDAEIYFEHNLPTACNIISMYAWLDVSDEN